MCVTLKLPECELKRQGRFVRRAEERGFLTKMMDLRHPSRPLFAGLVKVDTVAIKRQESWRISAKNTRWIAPINRSPTATSAAGRARAMLEFFSSMVGRHPIA